ncbi:MAG TPA: YihY/virulence factor BrkB family protein [Acidimicrobiia bacterium]|jgi:membrane protein
MAGRPETEHPGPQGQNAPEQPTDLPARSWWAVLRRTVHEARDDNLTDWAAALTYYSVLAIFPALLVLVALLGIFGQYPHTTNELLKIVGKVGPHSAVDTFRQPIESVVRNKGGAGALLGVGLLGAIWSASGYVGAFMRAANVIYEVPEGRRFWKLRPLQILVTLCMVLAAAVVALSIVTTGPLAKAIGDTIGLGHAAVLAWDIGKWPVLLIVVITMFSVLYYAAPNVRLPGFRWVSPGGILAVVVWLVASLAFGVYVTYVGSYNATYGSLGAVIIFLVWFWLTNAALLLGLEFNAELERRREIEAGDPDADESLQLPLRGRPNRRHAAHA